MSAYSIFLTNILLNVISIRESNLTGNIKYSGVSYDLSMKGADGKHGFDIRPKLET